jgi:hypothetical protein
MSSIFYTTLLILIIFIFSGILFHHFLSQMYRVDSSLCSKYPRHHDPHELTTLIPEYEDNNRENDITPTHEYHDNTNE